MGLLTGKTALVTGAARGIGKAVAMKFAQEGANIAFTDLVLNDDMAAGLEATRKEIEALGFKNRGVKIRTDLYVLHRTNSPAMLIECCFVDDKDDVELYDYKKMAAAIVAGILELKA